MGKVDYELKEARNEYEQAKRIGNRALEAQWANTIADILKNRGEYVEALRWLRVDYEISMKYLPQKQLLPTCQSLGEMYFRLEQFENALQYQKKHLELAEDSNNLIEEQRARTQLGRTYHEMFLKSENDHTALRNAKKYLKSAMKLACRLKENPPCNTSSYFVKELIDSHNNIGLLEFDLDNMHEAEKVLAQALKICDNEEVSEYDDARSRLHNSLGRVYLELREWSKARYHIDRDIMICRHIGHPLGESKGYINLGEVNFRIQKYDDANYCYQKALDIAKSLEDEKELARQIESNVETAKEAAKVLEELIRDEQKLKKLMRTTLDARGTSSERKCLLEQYSCLDSLLEKCSTIFAWPKHLEFAKRKKKVASELCDKEKLSDSLLAIGESYQRLRNFRKARKWYLKSWNVCRSIGNLEGQSSAKINIGSVLDSSGDWAGALQAFEEGYRLAVEGRLLPLQKTALENMHYSQMIRFDNIEEARKLLLDIQNLEHLLNHEDVLRKTHDDYCSETDTEGAETSDKLANACESPEISKPAASKPNMSCAQEYDDLVPLANLIRRNKKSSNMKVSLWNTHDKQIDASCNSCEASSGDLHESCYNMQSVGRKRVRVVISDDEAGPENTEQTRKRLHGGPIEEVATSDKGARQDERGANLVADVLHPTALGDDHGTSAPVHVEESSCSFKSKATNTTKSVTSGSKLDSGDVSGNLLKGHGGAVCNHTEVENMIACKIGNNLIHVDMNSCMKGNNLDTESMRIEVACRYYLKLYDEKRSKGLVPTIKQLKYCGKVLGCLEPNEVLKKILCEDIPTEAFISGWVPRRLMDAYVGCCKKSSEIPNIKLLKKLYNLEVSEDEVLISDCGLQDMSISSFLNALEAHKTVAVLDISHNSLGNETMEKLQQMFSSSIQKYGGLTLDLHCNWFGPTSLFQICECPVLFTRLEVLNLSQNRLTDSCSSFLCTILETCKALYSLNIEQCSITSRTIQKVADALHDGSILSHLAIGNNSPISGISMVNLLCKLASLKRFSELSLSGIRLNKAMVDGICKFASTSTLSGLLLGRTYIGMDGALRLTDALCTGSQELAKLDLSYCALPSHDFSKICANISLISGLLELNLEGNSIGQEACDSLRTILMDQQYCLKSLFLNKCHLGLVGITQIIQALSGNEYLEELHLAENADIAQERTLEYEPSSPTSSENKMEVADSDDEDASKQEPAGPNGCSASSSHRNQLAGSQLMQDLAAATESAVHLQLLDLSRNRLPSEAIEILYSSWSSRSGSCSQTYRHVSIDEGVVHFANEGRRCCGIRSCCKRD